ncbi:MAG: polymer-forming cytoskeletal protein, partial [Methanomicrobiales archaeon]|nr:polymer-forming cytoskeletal protein [Methanomicrobiales archaeon]
MKIWVHGETCYAPWGAYFDGSVRIEGNLVAPFGTHFWKHLTVSGDLELGPCSTVAGHVSCRNALIGGRAIVKGDLTAEGTVFVCDRAVLRSIRAGGDV